MKTYYCQKCGAKNSYELEKPSKCGYCKKNTSESITKTKVSQKSKSSFDDDLSCDFDFHFEDNYEIPSRNNPDFPSFVIEGSNISIQTIGDIQKQSESSQAE